MPAWLRRLLDWLRGGGGVDPAPPPGPGPDPVDDALLMLRLVNVARMARGLATLAGDTRLSLAARKHSARMAAAGRQSHQLPGEKELGGRLTAEGYRWGAAGEVIATGQTAQQALDAWMADGPHRAILLSPDYRDAGAGAAAGYWTVDVGSPAGAGRVALPGPLP